MKICVKCRENFTDDSNFCPFDGTKLEIPDDPWVGKIINSRYQIVEKLTEGGMGKIYRGLQLYPEREVAIKILPPERLKEKTFKERFMREGMAVAMIRHEHIIEIFDAGETDEGIPYIVMEFLHGDSLEDELLKGPLSVKRAVSILIDICEALGPVHAMGIIHRDLKPGNIFLVKINRKDRNGRNEKNNGNEGDEDEEFVKVLDFGIAFLRDQPRLTDKNLVVGTPEYIAPEIVLGGKILPQSDLYSLGCIGYEMLCGSLPLGSGNPAEIVLKHVNEKPVPLQNMNPDIPPELCKIIMRLLEKDPKKRYPDAYVLIKAFYDLGLVKKTEIEIETKTEAEKMELPVEKKSILSNRMMPSLSLTSSHKRWEEFLATTKDLSNEIGKSLELINEMETLTAKLTKIEKEQFAMGKEIEKIDFEGSESISRLRHALNALAMEISEKKSIFMETKSRLDELNSMALMEEREVKKMLQDKELIQDEGERISYGIMSKLEKISRNWISIYEKIREEESIKDKLQNEISDLDYQISQIRQRMESIEAETLQKKKGFEEKIKYLEEEKKKVKERLSTLSSIFGRNVK